MNDGYAPITELYQAEADSERLVQLLLQQGYYLVPVMTNVHDVNMVVKH